MRMKHSPVAALVDPSDRELVTRSLRGEREAFGVIVARYQSLVCSLAYSATGSVSASEDLAQETFVIAWQHLAELRDPDKLRPWLCGIARNTIRRSLRQRGHEPSHLAVPLDEAPLLAIDRATPAVEAITREEEELVWHALTQLPEEYREPLVLFYREGQSTAQVAVALDLSEELVRQRLSRARKMLAAQVEALIAGALRRTTPNAPFTARVLNALPIYAAASTLAGAKAVSGWAALKTLGIAGATGTLGGMLGGLLGALGGWWIPARLQIALARSPREKQLMRRAMWVLGAVTLVFLVVLLAGLALTADWRPTHQSQYVIALTIWNAAFALAVIALCLLWIAPQQKKIRAEDQAPPSDFERKIPWAKTWRYRSERTFLGLPLVAVRAGRAEGEWPVPAIGWIAIGDTAIGGLFACGGAALAPISIAGLALGGVTLGGAAAGLVALGGQATGAWAAIGGLAVARVWAWGGEAFARHGNDAAANAWMHRVFVDHLAQNSLLTLSAAAVIVVMAFLGRRRKV